MYLSEEDLALIAAEKTRLCEEMERKLRAKQRELEHQALISKQQADEERARRMMMNMTLGDVSDSELRANYLEYAKMLDSTLVTISKHQKQVSEMKTTGMLAGSTPLRGDDRVNFTKSQVNEYDAEMEKHVVEQAVCVIKLFHKLGIGRL